MAKDRLLGSKAIRGKDHARLQDKTIFGDSTRWDRCFGRHHAIASCATRLPDHYDVQLRQGRLVPRLPVVVFVPGVPVCPVELPDRRQNGHLPEAPLRLGRLSGQAPLIIYLYGHKRGVVSATG